MPWLFQLDAFLLPAYAAHARQRSYGPRRGVLAAALARPLQGRRHALGLHKPRACGGEQRADVKTGRRGKSERPQPAARLCPSRSAGAADRSSREKSPRAGARAGAPARMGSACPPRIRAARGEAQRAGSARTSAPPSLTSIPAEIRQTNQREQARRAMESSAVRRSGRPCRG